jgi:hypothetical protein
MQLVIAATEKQQWFAIGAFMQVPDSPHNDEMVAALVSGFQFTFEAYQGIVDYG